LRPRTENQWSFSMAGFFTVLHLLTVLLVLNWDVGLIIKAIGLFSPLLFLLSGGLWRVLIERRDQITYGRGFLVGILSALIFYFVVSLVLFIPTLGAATIGMWFMAVIMVPTVGLLGVVAIAIRMRWS